MGGKYTAGRISAHRSEANWRVMLVALGLSTALMAMAFEPAVAARDPVIRPTTLAAAERMPTALQSAYASAITERKAQQAQSDLLAAPVGKDWLNIPVRPGDSLSSLFEHYALPSQDWRDVLALGNSTRALRALRAGDRLHIQHDGGQLVELRYDVSPGKTLRVTRDARGKLAAVLSDAPTTVKHAYAIGTINNSLSVSAQSAGLPVSLAMELATIFGWDIDFAQDIRDGDRFAVIYEETYRHGQRIGTGDIVAAEFINQGRSHRAFRYERGSDANYFDEDGRPMRKAFLRTPVDFTRITSGFGWRKHPIAGGWRKHGGVDYAAPYGTPIKASGDGRVQFRGWRNGYGNTVVLKHGSGIETVYAHLSKFASGTLRGGHVKQGETIGYVGETGWATGPHLHYEFRINGKLQNPMAMRIPMADPLPKKHRNDFVYRIQPYVAQLNALSDIKLARNEN